MCAYRTVTYNTGSSPGAGGESVQDQNPKIGGRYIRLDQIGQGAVGTVFLCQDPVMDNRVAIKMLSGDASGQEMMRFQQEAKATARLNHPNIIKVLDFGESGGKAYLVMEYLEGESLESILARRDLSVDALLSIFCQVAGGLAYAHSQGVLHRDIKPSNVMVVKDDYGKPLAKLCDFGLAKLQSSDQELTRTGTALGSPSYMSPEGVNGEELDKRADVYSFGCMLFEGLTGRLPFLGESAFEVMIIRAEKDAPSLFEATGKDFPVEAEDLVAKCLARDRADRYENMGEIVEILEGIRAGDLAELDVELETEPDTGPHSDSRGEFEKDSALVEDDGAGAMEIPESEMPFKIKASRLPVEIGIFLALIIGALLVFRYFVFDEKPKAYQSDSNKSDKNQQKVPSTSVVSMDDFTPKEKVELADGREWTTLWGAVTDKDLKIFKGRKDIKYLKLVSDDLSGGGSVVLSDLPLLSLDLKQSALSDLTMDSVAHIQSLEELKLARALGVTRENIDLLSKLPRLKHLTLDNIDVDDSWISTVSRISHLESLSLRRCDKLEGKTIEELSALKELEMLNLSLSGFAPENIKGLASLSRLKVLYLSALGIEDRDLTALSSLNLTQLDLSDNRLGGSALKQLSGIKTLRILNLGAAPHISRKDVAAFKSQHPGCAVVGAFR